MKFNQKTIQRKPLAKKCSAKIITNYQMCGVYNYPFNVTYSPYIPHANYLHKALSINKGIDR